MLSEKSKELYRELMRRGYEPEFCRLVSNELAQELSAKRMLGYLRQFPSLPMGEIVDEMLAIMSDRDAWIRKKQAEHAQQTINAFMEDGFDADEGRDEDTEWD